jgi:hypothetical protein
MLVASGRKARDVKELKDYRLLFGDESQPTRRQSGREVWATIKAIANKYRPAK